MKISDIAAALEEICPLELAQDWDNVGFLVGDRNKDVKTILLTIDVTGEVVAEAGRLKTDLIVSYHPVIWDGLKKVTSEGPSAAVYELVRTGIAVFSIHTALDAATGGVNDGLADIVGICDPEPIGDLVENPTANNYKLVVFVPSDAVEKVAEAIFAAGAGRIGNYSRCAFQAAGQGSFLPMAGANPAIGRKGKVEKVSEVRFETVVPAERLGNCIEAMKQSHPYETPAFDCYRLSNPPDRFGLGRIGKLRRPTRISRIVERIKAATGAKAVGVVGGDRKLVKTAAVCAGSCGKIINSVIAAKADLYVTGELKHHHALAAQEAHLTCICLTHTVSERFMLKELAGNLRNLLPSVTIKISKKDKDPFKWMQI